MTISPITLFLILLYLSVSGLYVLHEANKNPLDTMCPEPYVCVIPPLKDSEIKINPFVGMEIYKKIEV
tara:strand:+ start:794 stop:997 length:204 start_codon:yes stop_codon:yes gene_type:complete